MKYLIAIIAMVALLNLPRSEHINNTVADSKIDKESRVVVTTSPRKKTVKPVKKPKVVIPKVITNCEQAHPLLARYFGDDIRIAKAVMQAESSCVSTTDNSGLNTDGTNDVGLMQINSVHCPHLIRCEDRTDPEKNLKAARQIYEGSGWSAWSAFNNGKYLQFIQ